MERIEPVEIPALTTIDLGDGIKRELCYGIDMVAGLKKRFGTLQKAMADIDENLAAFVMVGLIDPGEWTEAKIAKIHFSKFNGLFSAVVAGITGKTPDELKAAGEDAKNEQTQPTT